MIDSSTVFGSRRIACMRLAQLAILIFATGGNSAALAFEWQTAAPDDHGFSKQALEALQDDLARRSTQAFLVIRNDRIVAEWYAPGHSREKPHYSASMAKALVGGIALAVAIDDGRIRLDDPVAKFVPEWRDHPRKSQITVRQLGSHTSGLADAEHGDIPHERLTGWRGDFWKRLPPPRDPFTISRDQAPLEFDPGTQGQYSNPGIAMLSYAVTASLRDAALKDVRTLLGDRVMRPIGVPHREWSCGYGQTFSADGLPLVAAWGGGNFTARAAARIGRLMLRQGEWDGQRLIGRDAIRQITGSSGLPGDGGMGWWTNAGGRVPALPADAFWAAGAGGQVALVVPSLDLIAVRNGNSLDSGDNDVALDKYFFSPLMRTMRPADPLAHATHADLRPSPVIKDFTWAPADSVIRRAQGSDNWPLTWAGDDSLITAYGDGRGFEPFVPQKLSLGLARITGSPADFKGMNLRSRSIESAGDGAAGYKASGLLSMDGVLYMLVRNVNNSQLAWSTDRGKSWTRVDWKFNVSFAAPAFINFRKDYAGARDEFVYIVSHDTNSAYETADAFVLARAPRDAIRNRDAWRFFAGMRNGEPVWLENIAQRESILRNPGKCYRAGISYSSSLRRYLLLHSVPTAATRDLAGKPDARFAGGLAIYDAPEPWGPWTTVYYTSLWDIGPGETCSFPTKWMSADGKTLHMVFSGNDSFSVRAATLSVVDEVDESERRSSFPP